MFGIVRTSVNHAKGSSKTIPKHESKTLSEHKSVVRCARFSPDGMFFATGGADTSIKLFEVPKVKQMISGDTQARPLIRTFYDHAEVSVSFFKIFAVLILCIS
jgi:cleavage stimulation factor subunit 1